MQVGYDGLSTDEQNLDLQVVVPKVAGCKQPFSAKASGVPKAKDVLRFLEPTAKLVENFDDRAPHLAEATKKAMHASPFSHSWESH